LIIGLQREACVTHDSLSRTGCFCLSDPRPDTVLCVSDPRLLH